MRKIVFEKSEVLLKINQYPIALGFKDSQDFFRIYFCEQKKIVDLR